MIVEIVGGPRDGEKFATPSGTHHITFPVEQPLTAAWMSQHDSPPLDEATLKTITLPIRRTRTGKHIVIWKEQ